MYLLLTNPGGTTEISHLCSSFTLQSDSAELCCTRNTKIWIKQNLAPVVTWPRTYSEPSLKGAIRVRKDVFMNAYLRDFRLSPPCKWYLLFFGIVRSVEWSFFATFRDSLSFPSSRAKLDPWRWEILVGQPQGGRPHWRPRRSGRIILKSMLQHDGRAWIAVVGLVLGSCECD